MINGSVNQGPPMTQRVGDILLRWWCNGDRHAFNTGILERVWRKASSRRLATWSITKLICGHNVLEGYCIWTTDNFVDKLYNVELPMMHIPVKHEERNTIEVEGDWPSSHSSSSSSTSPTPPPSPQWPAHLKPWTPLDEANAMAQCSSLSPVACAGDAVQIPFDPIPWDDIWAVLGEGALPVIWSFRVCLWTFSQLLATVSVLGIFVWSFQWSEFHCFSWWVTFCLSCAGHDVADNSYQKFKSICVLFDVVVCWG